METFSNIETKLIYKWLGSQINNKIEDLHDCNDNELIVKLSEYVQELINQDLSYISEGFISEMINNSLDQVNYYELIKYYRQ